MSVGDQIKAENESLANLYRNPHYRVLHEWMESEKARTINKMLNGRKEESMRELAREAKTYQKVMQYVASAYHQMTNEPF